MEQTTTGAQPPARQEENPVKAYFANDFVMKKFHDIMGPRAQGFITSLLQVVNGNDTLKKANPNSIFNAAATAAVLDLPVNQNLGFAWIVPYNGQAQFQIGYKGFIQLAQRSGQYARLNMVIVYENQFKRWNDLTEELEADFSIEGKGEVVGYAAYFELINGYKKTTFWTKAKVIEHGKRFSKQFNSGVWKSDFDAMAMKTVLKNMLSKWGVLSIQMEKAIQLDQAVINDPEGNSYQYADNQETPEDVSRKLNSDVLVGMKDLTGQAKSKEGGNK